MTCTVFAKRPRSATYRTVSISHGMTIRREIWSSSFCFLGCVLLVPSSALLGYLDLPAIVGLITASLCLTIAATIDLYEASLLWNPAKEGIPKEKKSKYLMRYLGWNAIPAWPRMLGLHSSLRFMFFATPSKEISCQNKARRTFTSKLYFLGGAVFFLVASTMYLPFWASQSIGGTTMAELGTWVFRFGSFTYLAGNFLCIANVISDVQKQGRWLKQDLTNTVAICAFMLGSLFYISGGLVGQMNIGPPSLMSSLWVIGSMGFAIGSSIFLIDSLSRAQKFKLNAVVES